MQINSPDNSNEHKNHNSRQMSEWRTAQALYKCAYMAHTTDPIRLLSRLPWVLRLLLWCPGTRRRGKSSLRLPEVLRRRHASGGSRHLRQCVRSVREARVVWSPACRMLLWLLRTGPG